MSCLSQGFIRVPVPDRLTDNCFTAVVFESLWGLYFSCSKSHVTDGRNDFIVRIKKQTRAIIHFPDSQCCSSLGERIMVCFPLNSGCWQTRTRKQMCVWCECVSAHACVYGCACAHTCFEEWLSNSCDIWDMAPFGEAHPETLSLAMALLSSSSSSDSSSLVFRLRRRARNSTFSSHLVCVHTHTRVIIKSLSCFTNNYGHRGYAHTSAS